MSYQSPNNATVKSERSKHDGLDCHGAARLAMMMLHAINLVQWNQTSFVS